MLAPYKCPRWASKLKNVPQYYVNLVHKPTPIHEWNLSDVPKNFKLDIKRDDLTGELLSGNKLRKLEFIFADAIRKNSTCVITCGGLQFNHCHATAIVAKQLGLECHLLLQSRSQEDDAKIASASKLLSDIPGVECHTTTYELLDEGHNCQLLPGEENTSMYKLADELRSEGKRPYIIPSGGSCYYGTFGIVNSFIELISQGLLENYDDIVVPAGSGGTLAGLSVANYLTSQRLRIHGVCILDDSKHIYRQVESALHSYGLNRSYAERLCDIINGYEGEGLSKTEATESNLISLANVSGESAILEDYSYTQKAVQKMLNTMEDNSQIFKGNRVLYIHTGGSLNGIFGDLMNNDNVHACQDINMNPTQSILQ